ncbi:MAG: alanine racemase [Saprospiraceae bacterium]|jgi:alanine racemase
MLYTSYIEISESALAHNLDFIRTFIGDSVQFSSVVKGNAYGHGIEVIVPLEEKYGQRHFSVFSADEAFRVKEASQAGSTILIMGMLDNYQLEWAIENEIEFFVFNKHRLDHALQFARKIGKKALVHLEAETGMNRTGFQKNELAEAGKLLQENPDAIQFRALCTHYAGAESIANYYRIQQQKKRFKSALKQLDRMGLKPDILHTACSAASLRYPETQLDLVRIGILQYGFFPSKEILVDYLIKNKETVTPIERIISWKSVVMDIKRVKTGEFIGYGTSYFANSDLDVAIIPVGYSHGFSRSLSNLGRVLIRGQVAPVVGTVNMNMISVDISNSGGVQIGDEVVLVGRQGELEVTVASFSDMSHQINYELLTRLPQNLPRRVIE